MSTRSRALSWPSQAEAETEAALSTGGQTQDGSPALLYCHHGHPGCAQHAQGSQKVRKERSSGSLANSCSTRGGQQSEAT